VSPEAARDGGPPHGHGRRRPITWLAVASELQRDWARLETAKALGETVLDHASASGTAFAWELQLLNQKSGPA
jgi:hypothetical protein